MLEQMRLFYAYAKMVKLNLRLGPCKCDGTLKRGRIVMLVGKVKHFFSRRRNHGPECYAHGGSGGDSYTTTYAEDRVEHSSHRVGERPAIHDGNRCADSAPPAKKSRPICFILHAADAVPLNNGKVSSPDLGFAG